MKRKLSALFLLAFLLAAHMPAPGRADTEANIQTIYTYLTENAGLNRAAACGILSNIKSESNFNPEAIGDSGNAGSVALHRACGFEHVGTLKNVGRKFDRWVDVVLMQRALARD